VTRFISLGANFINPFPPSPSPKNPLFIWAYAPIAPTLVMPLKLGLNNWISIEIPLFSTVIRNG
jgi:hypothetical protein